MHCIKGPGNEHPPTASLTETSGGIQPALLRQCVIRDGPQKKATGAQGTIQEHKV